MKVKVSSARWKGKCSRLDSSVWETKCWVRDSRWPCKKSVHMWFLSFWWTLFDRTALGRQNEAPGESQRSDRATGAGRGETNLRRSPQEAVCIFPTFTGVQVCIHLLHYLIIQWTLLSYKVFFFFFFPSDISKCDQLPPHEQGAPIQVPFLSKMLHKKLIIPQSAITWLPT